MANITEISRKNWSINATNPTDQEIQSGCLQRIATAVEAMQRPYAALIGEREMYERWYREQRAKVATLEKQVAAYKGVIRRMKKEKAV